MKNTTKSQYAKQVKENSKRDKENQDRVNKKVNDEIFPVLKTVTANVEEGKLLPSVLKTVIQQAILNKMMKMTVKELDLVAQLKGGDKNEVAKYAQVIKLIEDEPISIAYTILDGLVEEITTKERLFMKRFNLNDIYAENDKKLAS
jgi:hypothetical protein